MQQLVLGQHRGEWWRDLQPSVPTARNRPSAAVGRPTGGTNGLQSEPEDYLSYLCSRPKGL